MNCIVCNSPLLNTIFNNTLSKCDSCGFVTCSDEYTNEELSQIYSSNYFNGGEYLDYLSDELAVRKNSRNRLKQIQKVFHDYRPENILEIGCAYGIFGDFIRSMYSNSRYSGYDIAQEACHYGQTHFKINTICQDFLAVNTSEIYSDVFMWDVIEHLPSPEKFIEKIAQKTVTGSRLFITTGDIERLLPKFQGEKWRQIHPPSHLHYFSKKTLSLLLEKNGFDVKKVFYPPISRSVKQTWYSLFLLNKKGNYLSKKIYEKIPKNLFWRVNTYDLVFVVAEKR
jgi:2-polyprenyl-3-methyl-5-hydroxy-6-metoxy-1,4-benzoquinol methylase